MILGWGLENLLQLGWRSRRVRALILIDERAGTNVAKRRGIRTTGTVAILAMAAERKLISLSAAFAAGFGLQGTRKHYGYTWVSWPPRLHQGALH
jgi:hypothetical protein